MVFNLFLHRATLRCSHKFVDRLSYIFKYSTKHYISKSLNVQVILVSKLSSSWAPQVENHCTKLLLQSILITLLQIQRYFNFKNILFKLYFHTMTDHIRNRRFLLKNRLFFSRCALICIKIRWLKFSFCHWKSTA